MRPLRRIVLVNSLKIFDLLVMMASFAVATMPVLYENSKVTFAQFLSMRVKVQNVAIFCGLLITWHLVFSLFGLYRSRRLSTAESELVAAFKAASVATLLIVLAAVLFHIRMVTADFFLVFWGVSAGTCVLSRMLLQALLRRIRLSGRNLRYVLVAGTNARAVEFARRIEAKPERGYRIIGFVDEEWNGTAEFKSSGYTLACNFAELPDFLRRTVVDEIMMALPIRSGYLCASQIAALCEDHGITLRFLPKIFDLKIPQSRAEEFDDDSLITLYPGAGEGWQHLAKRALDISISLGLLLLLSPFLAVIALAVKLTSSGPVFFVQKRVGLNKRTFSTYKFRTMVDGAELKLAEIESLNQVSGPVFKIENDPRVTPVGRLLRKSSIDELPQLLNVLKGDMSLVGPRPLPIRDYKGFNQDWHRRRLSVRPGITCLWQVNGRSSIPFEEWMELDMHYIDNWSLWLDLKILLKTIPAVLKGSGAA
jgi:exopolysaccharide biosynthesis polyprenyl glycosylphosphotransferase